MGKTSKVRRRKLVVVGDGGCGKTCLLTVYTRQKFPHQYVPTVFESYIAQVTLDGIVYDIALWDTAGQEDYDRLRPLSYPNTSVTLLCFAIDSPDSLDNVQEKWVEELTEYCSGVPIVLVGCKKDLRDDPKTIEELAKTSQAPVAFEEGVKAAKVIGAERYMECSAKLNEGVQEVFLQAVRSIAKSDEKSKQSKCICF
ncbi:small GTPase-binding protein [Backusella circina FSU 941]|nr:small GTPase-binding protein [Backusella circina FSU 941]